MYCMKFHAKTLIIVRFWTHPSGRILWIVFKLKVQKTSFYDDLVPIFFSI